MSAIYKARRLAELPSLLSVRARTTKELAERFGVPQRTIQRDLETLRDSGQGIVESKRGHYFIPSSSVQHRTYAVMQTRLSKIVARESVIAV
jgi:predicted DNA-binding transcriptional regulator YafY